MSFESIATLQPFTTLDLALLVVVLVSVLIGAWRGLVFELMSLAAWVLAWWGAGRWGGAGDGLWGEHLSNATLRHAIGVVLVFAAILVCCSLLARLARRLVSATPLSALDRLLGAAFGGVRGLVLLLLVATLVSWTPLAQADVWRGAQVVAGLLALQHGLDVWFPGDAWAAFSR